MDPGTGTNPNGMSVTLAVCERCGDLYALGAQGHENPPVAASTDRHKMASTTDRP